VFIIYKRGLYICVEKFPLTQFNAGYVNPSSTFWTKALHWTRGVGGGVRGETYN